jgi:hypothetical protein
MLNPKKIKKEWINECRDVKIYPITPEMYGIVKTEMLKFSKLHILNESFKKE